MAAQNFTSPAASRTSSGSTQEHARQKAGEVAGEAQQKTAELAEEAKHQAAARLSDQKDQATVHLDHLGSALHETSSSLRDRNEEAIAKMVDQAADQVDRLSHYLNTHTVTELMSEAERFARREPALFLGGAALLGLFGARFFKSSSPGRGYNSRDAAYAPPAYRRPRSYSDERSGSDGRQASRYAEPQRQQGYSDVHGTAGSEMPDPTRSGSSIPRSGRTPDQSFSSSESDATRRQQ